MWERYQAYLYINNKFDEMKTTKSKQSFLEKWKINAKKLKKENDFWESFDKQLLEAQAEEEDFELRKKKKNIVKKQDHIAKDQDRNYTEQHFKRDNLAQRKYFNFETIAEQLRNAKISIDNKAERFRNANKDAKK